MTGFTPTDEVQEVAERLVRYMRRLPAGSALSDALVQAIIQIYGSLDMFYQRFYQYLSEEELQAFFVLLEERLSKTHDQQLAAILKSRLFQEIIESLRRSGVSDVHDIGGRIGQGQPGKSPKGKGSGKGRF